MHETPWQGLRSVKYAAKYGVGFKVPNPIVIVRKSKSKEVRASCIVRLAFPMGHKPFLLIRGLAE